MTQYQNTKAKLAYETFHAQWAAADPAERGEEPQPPITYTAHVVEKAPEVLEAREGHIVAMIGDSVFESTSEFDDRFVVHPNDATNPNIWAQV